MKKSVSFSRNLSEEGCDENSEMKSERSMELKSTKSRSQSVLVHRVKPEDGMSWYSEYVPTERASSRHQSYSCVVTKEDVLGIDTSNSKSDNIQTSYSKDDDHISIDIQHSSHIVDENKQPISHEKLLIAATLVRDAQCGRHSDINLDGPSVRLYNMYHFWLPKSLLSFFIIINMSLAIFEKPAVPGFELPYWVTIMIEFSCILFYIFRFIHGSSFIKSVVFWSDRKNLILISTIVLTILDMIQYVSVLHSVHSEHAIRFSRLLRPIFLVNIHEGRQIRRAFRNIRRTLPGILNVLIIFFLTIALFALMALKLYKKLNLYYPDGTPYFQNYFDIYYDLYVLVTTANNPDAMMPAYDLKKWNALFFIIFLIIALYIFMSIILAVIYNNFRKHLKNEVKNSVLNKRKSLYTAFELLKVKVDGKFILSMKTFSDLLDLIPPKRSKTMKHVLWFVLDSDGDYKIGSSDFLRLADLLNVEVTEVKDRQTIFEVWLPRFYKSRYCKFVRFIVKHKFFRYFFDLLIIINAVLIGLDENSAEWFFLAIFSLEILLKIFTFGFKGFFSKFWNRFDFIVIGAAVIVTIIEIFLNENEREETSTLDIILVLRVLRLVKIVGSIKRFKVIVVTIANLGPSIVTYGSILFIFYYMYAMMGMEIFQNKIKYFSYDGQTDKSKMFCGNKLLNNSVFYQSHYCNNNFNDVLHSFVLLFELTVVNQWHVLASGFVIVTSKVARLYFITFHLICVIIILNIFTAFVLEAFIIEYSFSKGKLESAIETKIYELGLGLGSIHSKKNNSKKSDKEDLISNIEVLDEYDPPLDSDHDINLPDYSHDDVTNKSSTLPNLSADTDIRFHLTKGRKDVEAMLMRMFENEIEEEMLQHSYDLSDIQDKVDMKLSTLQA